MPIHLGVYVPIGDEHVLPAIVVEIDELCSKAQERNADRAQAAPARHICELSIVVVVIKIVCIIREVGLNNVGPTIVIVVGRINPHASLLAPVRAVSHSGFHTHFSESATAVVVVQHAGRRVVSHV